MCLSRTVLKALLLGVQIRIECKYSRSMWDKCQSNKPGVIHVNEYKRPKKE